MHTRYTNVWPYIIEDFVPTPLPFLSYALASYIWCLHTGSHKIDNHADSLNVNPQACTEPCTYMHGRHTAQPWPCMIFLILAISEWVIGHHSAAGFSGLSLISITHKKRFL